MSGQICYMSKDIIQIVAYALTVTQHMSHQTAKRGRSVYEAEGHDPETRVLYGK